MFVTVSVFRAVAGLFRVRHGCGFAAVFVVHHLARIRGQIAFAEGVLCSVIMDKRNHVGKFLAGEINLFAECVFVGGDHRRGIMPADAIDGMTGDSAFVDEQLFTAVRVHRGDHEGSRAGLAGGCVGRHVQGSRGTGENHRRGHGKSGGP